MSPVVFRREPKSLLGAGLFEAVDLCDLFLINGLVGRGSATSPARAGSRKAAKALAIGSCLSFGLSKFSGVVFLIGAVVGVDDSEEKVAVWGVVGLSLVSVGTVDRSRFAAPESS